MRTTLLLLTLAQTAKLVMWTDEAGVVHVDAANVAPASARPIDGDTFSVIDADGRPAVLPDGGTRERDSASWRARFAKVRGDVEALRALEGAAASEASRAAQPLCVTATTTATARVSVPLLPPPTRRPTSDPRLWWRSQPRQTLETSQTSETTTCVPGNAAAQRAELARVRVELSLAEQALRALERDAIAAHVPLRDM